MIQPDENSGTHIYTCSICGYEDSSEQCIPGGQAYTNNAGQQFQYCTICGSTVFI